jgi:hypothetical protein
LSSKVDVPRIIYPDSKRVPSLVFILAALPPGKNTLYKTNMRIHENQSQSKYYGKEENFLSDREIVTHFLGHLLLAYSYTHIQYIDRNIFVPEREENTIGLEHGLTSSFIILNSCQILTG